MAKNVLEIRQHHHCKNHNRPCLNQNAPLNAHIEITFMMLSIWSSEMVMFYLNIKISYNIKKFI